MTISVLRPWSRDDGPWYVGQVDDAAIQRFTTESTTTTVEDFVAALSDQTGRSDVFARAIVDPDNGALAGNLAASIDADTIKISYWLAPSARGLGLARRAVVETLDKARSLWPHATVAALSICIGNDASQRIARSLGFARDTSRDVVHVVRDEPRPMQSWILRLGDV